MSASALTAQIGEMTSPPETGEPPSVDFGKLLKKAGGMGDVRDCPVGFKDLKTHCQRGMR